MGVEVEAGGCPAWVTPTPPRLGGGRENGGCTGGRGGGVPGLAVLCAACLGRPARRPRALLRSSPASSPVTRPAARQGEGAASRDGGRRRGYVTPAAGGESVFGLGGGAVCACGGSAGEDAPASPGSPSFSCYPPHLAAPRRRPGEDGADGVRVCVCEVGNVQVCVFNSSGVLIR